ncbi:MAG: hypothetical protein ACFFCS_29600 [Candidatus Hodarchaeota archaeon]
MYISPFSIVLMAYNLLFILGIAWQLFFNKKTKEWKEFGIMEEGLVLLVQYCVSLVITPFILNFSGADNKGKDVLYLIGIVFFGLELLVLFFILARNYVICKKNPSEKDKRQYEQCVEEIHSRNDELKRDFSRKILHVIVSVSLVLVNIIATELDKYYKSIDLFQGLGVTARAGIIGLTICVFWGFSFMFTLQDLVRLNIYYTVPGWGRSWITNSLRKKECYSFSASSSILLGLVPFLMAPHPVFFTISFISTASDAASSTIGMRFGKHKIGINKDKSYEGLIAGIIMTFVCVVLVNLFFFPAKILQIMLLTTIITAIYGLFDASIKKVNDNFMNTIVLGFITWVLHNLILL